MHISRLVLQEIRYRKIDFILGVFAVVVASGCLVAVMTLLRGHALRVSELMEAQQADTLSLMRAAEDDYRKITKKLGYNILILAKEQDLNAFHTQGYATALMPESYVEQLVNQKVMTIRHLLPTLHEKITWDEQDNLPVILVGVRGEATLAHRPPRKSMLDPVQPGEIRIGSVLHERLGLNKGDTVRLKGRSFTISEVQPPRGNADDVTVWVHLKTAQEMLKRPGKINAIMALSCHCQGAPIEGIRKELLAILPDTQAIELVSRSVVRDEARSRVSALSRETVEDQAEHHAQLREAREAFAAWLVPLILVGATVWIGLLTLGNVRERTTEIGIWRALGFRSTQVLRIFVTRAMITGLAGAALGWAGGFLVGVLWSRAEGVSAGSIGAGALVDMPLLAAVLLLSPLLTALASWLPAMLAAQQDPAQVLRQE